MTDLANIIETTLVLHTAFEEATTRIEQCFHYAQNTSEPICIALVGESRTGKSRALEECRNNHPTIRIPEGLVVPILYVKTQSKPTVKGLAELMLHAIGDPKYLVGTENNKSIRLQTLIRNTGTRMIMIDEFQHFYDKVSHQVMHHVADWLKILVDDCKLALVVAGLPNCLAVLAQNEQLKGRFLTPIFMPRFDWRNEDYREDFIAILSAFHESLSEYFDLPAIDQPQMAFRCYCATGGIIGYLTKFLRQVVLNALDAGVRIIELKDFFIAYKQSIWMSEMPSDLPNPFSKTFETSPTEELLEKVSQIGEPAQEKAEPRRNGRKGRRHVSIQSVLTSR